MTYLYIKIEEEAHNSQEVMSEAKIGSYPSSRPRTLCLSGEIGPVGRLCNPHIRIPTSQFQLPTMMGTLGMV